MKKLSLILISLLLCLSMILVGCNSNTETPTTKPTQKPTDNISGEQNGGNATVPTSKLDKEALVADFNEIDLGALMDSISEGEIDSPVLDYAGAIMGGVAGGEVDPATLMATVLPLFNELAAGIDASMTFGEASATATLAVKDGIAYVKAVNAADDTIETYVCFGKGEIMLFQKDGDAWIGVNPFEGEPLPDDEFDSSFNEDIDLMADFEENGEADMMAEIKEMLKAVVIPELKAEHLIAENGMLVLDNEYLVELVGANAGISVDPDYEVSEEEIEELKKEVRADLSTIGLKIAFDGEGKIINKFVISIAIDDSEEGKALKADSSMAAASFEINASADGALLNSVKFTVTNDFSDIIAGYKPTSTVSSTFIYNDDKVLCGEETKMDIAVLVNNEADYIEDNDGNYTITGNAVALNIKADLKLDMSKIGKTNEDVMTFDLDMNIEKAVDTVVKGNWMSEAEEEITSTPVSADKYGEYFTAADMDFKLTSTDANKLSFKGTMTPDAGEGKVDFAATIYLNDILNFPTSIPQEITDYMTAE